MNRRVVVTGIGLVSALGVGTEATWEGLCAGRCGVGPITRFDASAFAARIAAEVKGFDPLQYVDKKDVKKMDTFIHYAIAASQSAAADAGLVVVPEDAARVGVFIASGIGGFGTIEREHQALLEGGPRKISPFFIPAAIINLAAGQVSIRLGAKGPNLATSTACAASAHAVGEAFEIIRRGAADAMIAGGSEAAITPMGVGGFAAMRALSTRNDEPERASRPFDKERDGFVIGEGAGVLVLEELETRPPARRPGLRRGRRLRGDGRRVPHHGAVGGRRRGRSRDGDGAGLGRRRPRRRAVHQRPRHLHAVQRQARVAGHHARCSAPHADGIGVSSTKSMIGHTLGAAGGIEAGITALAVYHQTMPPTINQDTPDPECTLDYVPWKARTAPITYAMSNSFGFGGTNAALLLRRFDG